MRIATSIATTGLALLLILAGATADDIVVQREERVIPPGQTATYELPPMDPGDRHLLMEFEARMESPKPGGSMFYLDVRLDDEPIAAAQDRLTARLLNKPLGVPYRDDTMLYWYAAGTGWRVVYAPDFESFGPAQDHGPEPYRFVVDVTDMIEAGRPHDLSFQRVAGTTQAHLVIRNVKLRTAPEGATPRASRYALQPVGEARVRVSDDGALVIGAGGREYRLSSTWSWPGAGLNALGAKSGSSRWRVTMRKRSATEWVVEGADPAYQLRRRVSVADGRVRVRDEVTNRRDQPLGIVHRHELGLGDEPVPVIYLGGNPDPTVTETYPRGNTTLFVPLGAFGLGLALEDDAARCQSVLFAAPEALTTGWRNARLALAPRETYALEWSLYPCPHGDYWTFINRVRTDWGVNDVTVQGPYGFIQPIRYGRDDTDVAALREQLQQGRQWGVITGGGWHYDDDPKPRWLAFGVGILGEPFAEYRRLLRRAIENFHAADPAVKFLVYVHCFYNSPQTEAEKERFRDSWVTKREGEQQVKGWGDIYKPSPMVFATLNNSFGPAFLRACEGLLDDFGATGLYLDESNGHGGYTWNAWDGRSAEIDPETYEISALIGNPVLMSSPVRLALEQMTAERGKAFIANGHPYLGAENRARFPRFVEAQHLASRAAETHLYTPLVWDYGSYQDTSRLRRALSWGTIPVRLNLSLAAGPFGHLYPLTTREVHEGWILARERIIISASGRYCWPGEAVRARVHTWQADLTEEPVREVTVNGPTQITVPAGGVVVIERT
jgi:hypothetical protein